MLSNFILTLLLSVHPLTHFYHTTPDCNDIPAFNKSILAYVKSQVGKKVGRGQCWDLAAEALNSNMAKWNGQYEYGRLINHKTECVYPGDIIQFYGVRVEIRQSNGTWWEEMEQHTAIVYEVNGHGSFTIAHQNYGRGPKKVVTTPLDLKHIKRGKIKIYRPQP